MRLSLPRSAAPWSCMMFALSLLSAAACSDEDRGEASGDSLTPDPDSASISTLATGEGFEAGSKTSYAAADVALTSGTWNLSDALIGSSASDIKSGNKAARVRNSGRVTMRFNRSGAGVVSVRHAAYGADGNGTWALFSSQSNGSTWTQVGNSVTTSGHTLTTATFNVDVTGTIRFELRKLNGGSNRINFDDIAISDIGGDGGGGGGSGGGGGGGGGATISRHTALGLPAPASATDVDAFLSVKSEYVLSYNSSLKIPNWVAWELNSSYLGSTPRQDDFRVDTTLPATVEQATLADYSGSGYDRGHMAPSGDRTRSVTSNSQTFYLTNMVPQAGNNNRGPWARLEEYTRTLVAAGKEVFIVSGGTFSASSNWVGSGVMVPDQTFKVIVVLDATTQGAGDVTAATRVIAVLMPNEDSQISLGADWHNYRVSVDAIESLTGNNFLSDVSPTVQAVVEARVDNLP